MVRRHTRGLPAAPFGESAEAGREAGQRERAPAEPASVPVCPLDSLLYASMDKHETSKDA